MYTDTALHIDETTPEEPPTKKGRIRKEISDQLREAESKRGLRWATVRATDQSMFGTGRFLDLVSKKANPALIGKLDTLHSYTIIDDFREALVTIALDPRGHHKAWICPNAPARTTGEIALSFFDENIPPEATIYEGKPSRTWCSGRWVFSIR